MKSTSAYLSGLIMGAMIMGTLWTMFLPKPIQWEQIRDGKVANCAPEKN